MLLLSIALYIAVAILVIVSAVGMDGNGGAGYVILFIASLLYLCLGFLASASMTEPSSCFFNTIFLNVLNYIFNFGKSVEFVKQKEV